MEIRNATLADLPYLYDICAKTALDGEDARQVMSDDNKVGHYFAAPYCHFDLQGCFVLCENGLVKGYLLGVLDTQKYQNWLNTYWLEQIRPLYKKDSQAVAEFDAFLNSVIHNNATLDDRLKNHSAHFHIDLLPEYQAKGYGKQLIKQFSNYCLSNNITKIHLMVSSTHKKALGFYKHLGFYELFKTQGANVIGFDITPK